MLTDGDKLYLQTNLRRNRVVLFLGAGFSGDAENFAREPLPLSRGLAEKVWTFLEFPGGYDGTELRYLYDAARKRKGDATVRIFLRDLFAVSRYPDWYKSLAGFYWRRIYTTNIDNLIETLYAASPSGPGLDRVVAPDDFADRDAFLREIQFVKLHGSIDEAGRPLVFSPIEYGRRASLHDIWYDHFLRDYSSYPTVLVGTELNEPLFWQYLAARQDKPRGSPESRPKSFLVSPNISRARIEALSLYNIEPIEATAEQFLTWLSSLPEFKAPREVVLREVDPSLEELVALERSGTSGARIRAAEAFFTTFDQVRPQSASASARRDFLLGVQPGWDDIARGLDADREVNKTLADAIHVAYREQPDHVPVVVLHGSAGSGKSTTTMRVAHALMQSGAPVYFSAGKNRLDSRLICSHMQGLGARPILVFDNAAPDLRLISALGAQARELSVKPIILVSLRSNQWFQKRYLFQDFSHLQEVEIPNLSAYDIGQILTVLERERLLGALQTMNPEQRADVFLQKARKQILVAMREATKGAPFNEILRDEFNCIEPEDARLLFLIVAIPTMHQFHIGFDEIVAAMDLPPAQTGSLLRQALSGIVVPHPQQAERYAVRHPVVAEYVALEVVRPELLAEAYSRYLQVIAHEMSFARADATRRVSRIFRDLINHENLRQSFPHHPNLCRQIYDSVREHYGNDGHYWFQYGVYELQCGHLDLAENYLLQAQGFIPHSESLSTAFGHLSMRKAIEAVSLVIAIEQKSEGEKILRAQIARIGFSDPYPYHVLGSQMLSYINRWVPPEERPTELRRLHDEIKPGADRHRLATYLRTLLLDIKKAELDSVVSK
jgi:hypothetical protein